MLNPEHIDMLKSYIWPGNVQQLECLIQRLVLSSKDGIIPPERFPITLMARSFDYEKLTGSFIHHIISQARIKYHDDIDVLSTVLDVSKDYISTFT